MSKNLEKQFKKVIAELDELLLMIEDKGIEFKFNSMPCGFKNADELEDLVYQLTSATEDVFN